MMARYKILVRHSVYKDTEHFPKKDLLRIIKAISGLSEEPRPPQSRKLSGEEKYRLRCGSYRVLYEIRDEELIICIVRIRHRKDVYRP
jgi:mRNA interferase RelE/StbE